MKINVDFYDSLPVEKNIDFPNVECLIHINSVLNKDQHHYYYNVFLEKCLSQVAKKYSQSLF